ncbi:MAG TPA: PDZ domain-containing protein [Gemmatimonadaceae bacterium]
MRRLALVVFLAALPAASAQAPRERATPRSAPISEVRYRLQFDAAHGVQRSVGVEMTFAVGGREPVLLSLPAWTPGAYEISNYARMVSGFSATSAGKPLRWDKLGPDTWRIQADGAREVTVSFESRADSLDNAFNWARDEFALVNGTNVFPYAEGRPLEFASTVSVRTEQGWRVTSGLPALADGSFAAPNYHELVDAPFFVGRFDLDSTRIVDRWVRLATYPSGSEAGPRRAALWDALRRAIPPQASIFGETPWSTYTVMQIADSGFGGMSALEHQNSNVGIVGSTLLDEPFVPSVYAHEIFHAYNVKRLRPLDMWPYRYDQAQPTPWLWVSEGITDYYADLSQVRGGVITAEGFLRTTQGKMDHVAQLPPVSLEDASLQAWIHMTDGTADIYYDKGSLAGLALDILIRDASDNQASLDHVLRELYASTYKLGRGFTPDEWWGAVGRAARGASFRDFSDKYVNGREPYPWGRWLAMAGWRLVTDSVREVRLGAMLAPDSAGLRIAEVSPGSAAMHAGLRAGDVLLKVAGVSATDPDFNRKWHERAGNREGAPLAIDIRRDGTPMTVTGAVRVATLISTRLEDDPAANARALRIRAGILSGTTTAR